MGFIRRSSLMLLLAALLLAPLAAPLSGTVLSLNPTFPVASPGCLEAAPDIAPLPGGGYVVVWQGGSDTSGSGQIQARIFGRGDNPLGASFRVSSGQGRIPAVAVRPDGHFLVLWKDHNATALRARLFGPTGAPAAPETALEAFAPETTGLDVAALPDGRFAATWNGQASVYLTTIDADGQARVSPFEIEALAGFTGVDPRIDNPAIAAQPDGDAVVVWTVRNASTLQFWHVDGMIVPTDPSSAAPIQRLEFNLDDGNGKIAESTVGTDGAGNIVVAWKEDARDQIPNRIAVQLFDPAGQPRGAAFRADEGSESGNGWQAIGGPALAVSPAGFFTVAWDATPEPEPLSAPRPVSNQIYARVFDAQGNALGEQRLISPGDLVDRHAPALAWTEGREVIAVWQDAPSLPLSGGCFSDGIVARRIFTGCLPGPDRLCLGEGRFELGVTWNAPFAGGTGAGKAVAVTRDTGYFWFFNQENVELMVKVLDGRAVNDHFWVFYGSLSDVAWTLTVDDLVTRGRRIYSNPQGQLASRGDTLALSASTAAAAQGVTVEAFDTVRLDRTALPAGPAGPASPAETALAPAAAASPAVSSPVLTLHGDFLVDVAWRDPFNGGSGVGQGVPLTGDSGYFWFFDPNNVELVVKVLDGRAVNGKFWVFYGALTNVEYDLRVRHGGAEKVYHNPPFLFRSRADTRAFDANGN